MVHGLRKVLKEEEQGGGNAGKQEVTKETTKWGDRTVVRKTRTASKENEMDKVIKDDSDWDYELADKFNNAGSNYIRNLAKKGEKEALRLLDEELKDYSYTFIMNNEKEIWEGEEYVYQMYELNVHGNKFGYRTQGEEDYYDEDFFYDLNRLKR